MKKELYLKEGYAFLRHGIDFTKTDFEPMKFDGSHDDLIREAKDYGALKASGDYLQLHIDRYVNYLHNSNIITQCELITGCQLYPYKLMHLISDAETRPLPWHRDSYIHMGKQIGPNPPPIKLGIYLSGADKNSGATGFLRGSFQRKINNRYVDYIYTILTSFRAVHFQYEPGDAGLWDGAVMHHRAKNNGQRREAVIFGLLSSWKDAQPWLSDDNNPSLLAEYMKASRK